jgi:hypothetical protein
MLLFYFWLAKTVHNLKMASSHKFEQKIFQIGVVVFKYKFKLFLRRK